MTEDKYRYVIDVWEGSLEINEQTLHENNIDGIITRLNDMNGGHHRDTGFDKQWLEAESFLRAPYFVYNPWVDGQTNYSWMMRNIPSVPMVCVDVEVKYAGYSPDTYAMEVENFLALCDPNIITKIYTGPWFLPFLGHWPKDHGYWWGRYPYAVYPPGSEYWTWEKFKTVANTLTWPVQYDSTGPIELWQCTGDRLILPGSIRTLDVNLWPGTKESLSAWFGYPFTVEQRLSKLETDMKLVKMRLGL